MSLRIELNGITVARNDVQGDRGITVTITMEGDDGEQKRSATGQLTFYGQAFAIIKSELIDPPDGKLRELPLLMYETCQGEADIEVFRGVLRGDTISWCEDGCSVNGRATEKTEDTAAIDCLKSTLIYDNHAGFLQQDHPRMVYCDELRPDWLHHLQLIHGITWLLSYNSVLPIVLVFATVINSINLVITAINALGADIDLIDFDGDPGTDHIQEWENLRQELIINILGCGRKHPSPLLRAYINNVCIKCGLTFQSSILNDPASDYYNTVYFSAPVKKGTYDDNLKFIYENRPLVTGDKLLTDLKPVFNAGKRVMDGVLHFERKDKLPQDGPWVDPQQLKAEGRLIGSVCYKWSTGNPFAFLQIGFSEDALDIPGNEANGLYRGIIEWNQPFNPMQKGEDAKLFRYGMLRCRRDGEGVDVLDDYEWWPDFTSYVNNEYAHVMMLSKGLAALPKLLIWNGNLNHGEVQRQYDRPGYVKPFDQNYNWPYHINEWNVAPNTPYEPNAANLALYGRFHAINNPKVLTDRGVDFDFTFSYTAAHLTSFGAYKTIPLPSPMGVGKMKSVTINLTERTILVAGKA